MDNHPHLSGHLENKEDFSAFFRIVNSMFARLVNKKLKRRGQLVMDRRPDMNHDLPAVLILLIAGSLSIPPDYPDKRGR